MGKAKELAEKTAQMQSSFLANMSHEIKTPMNGILSMLDLSMLEDLDEQTLEHLEVVKSSADSLLLI